MVQRSFFHIEILLGLTSYGYLTAVFVLGYFVLRQEEIFPYTPQDTQLIREIVLDDKQKKARLPDKRVDELKAKLITIMEEKKPYLDPSLSLPDLARKVDISTHALSFVLNAGFGEIFFQFVNRYRVEEAKRLLVSEGHRHLNMIGIAFESGFNSKTTFNTTFKKFAGLAPSDFVAANTIAPGPERVESA